MMLIDLMWALGRSNRANTSRMIANGRKDDPGTSIAIAASSFLVPVYWV